MPFYAGFWLGLGKLAGSPSVRGALKRLLSNPQTTNELALVANSGDDALKNALGSSLQETLTQYAEGSMTGAEVMPALQKSLGDFSTLAKMQKTPAGAFAGMFLEQAKKSAETAAESPLIAKDFERGMEENLGVEKGDVVESNKGTAFKIADMTDEEVNALVAYVRPDAPIEIPQTAKVIPRSKVGYEQVSFQWRDDTYRYEVRWHTRTPGAPKSQGESWVIERSIEGIGYGKNARPKIEMILIGENQWIPKSEWKRAISARKQGAATDWQIRILDNGHWKGKIKK